MFKEIFVGVVSVGGVAASVFAGMQLEQRLAAGDVADAIERSYARGIAETEERLADLMTSAEITANVISSLERAASENGLPLQYRDQLSTAVQTAQDGDPATAIELAENAFVLIGKRNCMENGIDFTVEEGDFFDHCATGAEISVTDIFWGGDAALAIEGKRVTGRIGERFDLSAQCYLTLASITGERENSIATFRASCN